MKMEIINGQTLKNMLNYGVFTLNQNRESLNSLNIFPVPDGDTGTNMSLTSLSSYKELEKLPPNAGCDEVAAAVASGSLRGARGNSGVILSQLFRGFSKGIKGKKTLTTTDFADALTQSSETAYKAVMKPKDGTVLTIARESALKAQELAAEIADFEMFLKQILDYSKAVLKQTTEMLPALKAAGVVDAGGKGLVHIYEGYLCGLSEKAPTDFTSAPAEQRQNAESFAAAFDAEIKFGYCTEFFIERKNAPDTLIENIARYLETLGDSVVAAADDSVIKIHVHTNNPGSVLEYSLTLGALSSIKIDNMRIQHTELAAPGFVPNAAPAATAPNKTNKDIGVITISVGDGINGIFRELGCDGVIEGGQTMNPSAEDILRAAEAIDKPNLIVLPNNKNIILAAKQAAAMLEHDTGRSVRVVETKSIPQGIGAMISMVHGKPLEETAEAMEFGAKCIKTGHVTEAVRDTQIDGKSIKKGDYLGIIDGVIEAVESSSLLAGKRIIKKFSVDCELITIYFSERSLEKEGAELCDYVFEQGLECEMHYGGQPVYSYVISAE